MARGQVVRDRYDKRDRNGRRYTPWQWCVSREEHGCYLAGMVLERSGFGKVRFTYMESQVMAALMLCERGTLHKLELAWFLYGGEWNWPLGWDRLLATYLSRVRAKIRPLNITIARDRGWELKFT